MTLHAPAVRTGAFWELQAIYVYMVALRHSDTPEPSTCTVRVETTKERGMRYDVAIIKQEQRPSNCPHPLQSVQCVSVHSAAVKVLSNQSSLIRSWFSVVSYLGHSSFRASVTHHGEVREWQVHRASDQRIQHRVDMNDIRRVLREDDGQPSNEMEVDVTVEPPRPGVLGLQSS